ncbi:MAG: UDP-N-acetylmuramoyl-tripeptide--D-alanyl-D-alanine ligase [Candidatus Pacebacteria bacterium]|nr:UDP-N-acetylmuramoyl-tripeptide--D-alanyl-D-alanine ligase [Candidatus Paceibacterota bacterium]
MRTTLKQFVAGMLAMLAREIVRKYRPKIIMITGSVGKTSTKDAVAAALSESFQVRKSEKSYNSDFGVPLTIFGVKNPWTSVLAWIGVIGEASALIIFPNHYPNLLVLEVGADRPGDLKRILKIAKPAAVVVTLLPNVPVHVEAYETPAAVREEEFLPATALPAGAPLIVSADDQYALTRARLVNARLMTFGMAEEADVRIEEVGVWEEDGMPFGMKASLVVEGKSHEMKVRGAFGRSQLYAPAAATAAAVSLGVPMKEALASLTGYVPPPGRGRIFAGKKGTVLLDDSYNSSPAAVEEALRSLELLRGGAPLHGMERRRVAILGDMLELGRYSMAEHARIGHTAYECLDLLITVGARARTIGETAIQDGMAEGTVTSFNNSLDASHAVEDLLQEGDIVLVKGSQGIRLERIVKALLADSGDIHELVRQEQEWTKR